jgi:aspartate/methionine/tyrosine aminotransferase
MFSARLPRLEPNALSQALTRARAGTAPLLDLSESNPTAVGLEYPASLLDGLANPAGLAYRPDPTGLAQAREAVAREFARQHRGTGIAQPTSVHTDRIVLTSGTSEAYSMLFKLLCDAGDEVLIPAPSYPLFDLLSGLDAVTARPYALDPLGRWRLDRPSLERAANARSRGVLVVSPNNPTGSMLDADDRDWLVAFCADRQLAIIADEVFADYPHAPTTTGSSAPAVSLAGETRALTFTLGGLSKSAGLPQLKLAWMLVSGPDDLVDEAMRRLEVICDTYLSVSTPVQLAARTLIDHGREVRQRIQSRLTRNLDALAARMPAYPDVTLHRPDGGWSAVLRIPSVESEESLALSLLRRRLR